MGQYVDPRAPVPLGCGRGLYHPSFGDDTVNHGQGGPILPLEVVELPVPIEEGSRACSESGRGRYLRRYPNALARLMCKVRA